MGRISYLPNELINLILSNLNYKQIVLFRRTCKRFNSLDVSWLIEQIKYTGFPRTERKCMIYNLSSKSINLSDEKRILNYLFDNNATYGDLVVFDCKYIGNDYINSCQIRIFDGIKLLELLYNANHISLQLPYNFKVIENDVPINYWNKGNTLHISIFNKYVIWFDSKLVHDQFKIEYGLLEKSSLYGLWTYFNYKGERYRIVYDYPMHDDECIDHRNYEILDNNYLHYMVNEFKNKLNSDNCVFLLVSDANCYKNDGFTLFCY